MTIKPVYIYEGIGGTIQSPIKLPIQESRQMRRLIADEGKELVKGDMTTSVIDVELNDVENWTEIDKPEDK